MRALKFSKVNASAGIDHALLPFEKGGSATGGLITDSCHEPDGDGQTVRSKLVKRQHKLFSKAALIDQIHHLAFGIQHPGGSGLHAP
jgi:hypothetical protein